MKLKTLSIRNFRGLKGDNNVIDFSQSNIIFLIGKNNVGKSSFLRAYEFFIDSKQVAQASDFFDGNDETPIEIEGVFIREENDENDNDLKGKKPEPDWLDKWVDADGLIKVKKVWTQKNASFSKYTFLPATQQWVENGFGGLPTLFQKYSPTPLCISAMETETSLEEKVNKLIQDDCIKRLKDDYPDDFTSIVRSISELQTKIMGSDAIKEYNSDINEYFQRVFSELTLKIEAKHEDNIKLEDAFKKNHTVNVQKQGVDRREVFQQHGHGVIRQALYNFITFLKKERVGRRKEYLILFEEPELFLHPEATFKLRKSLYELAENSPYQIICATHSPMMIDISKPHASLVRVTKNTEEQTETFQVGDEVFRSDEEKSQRIQMINRFNPHVCESFYANSVIIVEGDTEAIVFRDLINRYFNQFEVYVLNAGSKNNIPFFQEIFTAFNIEHYVVHDCDSRFNSDGGHNSAWTLNQKIWDKVVIANTKRNGLARRYIHASNFEIAHNIVLTGKDKPIRAYDYVGGLTDQSDVPCVNWLRDIIFDRVILHDHDFVEGLEPLN